MIDIDFDNYYDVSFKRVSDDDDKKYLLIIIIINTRSK